MGYKIKDFVHTHISFTNGKKNHWGDPEGWYGEGHSKGDQSWVFFGRNDAKAETPVLWPQRVKS